MCSEFDVVIKLGLALYFHHNSVIFGIGIPISCTSFVAQTNVMPDKKKHTHSIERNDYVRKRNRCFQQKQKYKVLLSQKIRVGCPLYD